MSDSVNAIALLTKMPESACASIQELVNQMIELYKSGQDLVVYSNPKDKSQDSLNVSNWNSSSSSIVSPTIRDSVVHS